MNDTGRRNHWEGVYAAKSENQVSWFQETPAISLELIERAGAIQSSGIIDIGGGASRLADCLVARGYRDGRCSICPSRRWLPHAPAWATGRGR